MTSDEPIFHKAPMEAVTFGVTCPICQRCTEIEWVDQDDAGVWYPRADCQFVKCSGCGTDIEVQGVTMEGTAQPPFRNTGSR